MSVIMIMSIMVSIMLVAVVIIVMTIIIVNRGMEFLEYLYLELNLLSRERAMRHLHRGEQCEGREAREG